MFARHAVHGGRAHDVRVYVQDMPCVGGGRTHGVCGRGCSVFQPGELERP
jgi:hypothetical protein